MRLEPVDIRLLRVFRTVVDAGGFAQAATELNVGASTISVHMSELENRLGFALCTRGRGGFALTEKGRQAFALTHRLFKDLDDCAAGFEAIHGRLSGVLNIGLIDYMTSVPEFNIASAVAEFAATAPDVVLNLQVLAEAELTKALVNGALHLGIGPNESAGRDLNYASFLSETLLLYRAPEHALAKRTAKKLTAKEVLQHRFVGERHGDDKAGRRASKFGADAPGENLEMIAIMILSGQYIGYLPTHFAEQWVSAGRMTPILPRQFRVNNDLMLLTARNRPENEPLGVFLDILERACR